ncbi:MAG: hypothetical protein M3Y27_12875, partial [Acidobacteriota bacterium]|nr:hypothetical protein [Acidobacteriota bacterium]
MRACGGLSAKPITIRLNSWVVSLLWRRLREGAQSGAFRRPRIGGAASQSLTEGAWSFGPGAAAKTTPLNNSPELGRQPTPGQSLIPVLPDLYIR